MARWHRQEPIPAALRQFTEAAWPPVPGECLGRFACRGGGYEADCAPRPGETCGQSFYAALGPAELEAACRTDAVYRWRQARMACLGEDDPAWLDEFIAGLADGAA